MSSRVWLSGVALVAFVACSGGAPDVTVSGATLQYADEREICSAKVLVVLTVDDEDTPDATSIRMLATGALRATFEDFAHALPGDTDGLRVDLLVVVVDPSVAGSGRAVGPGDNPALSLVSENASIAEVDAVADAASASINGAIAPAGAPYTPLESTALTVELVSGTRPPADAHEASLVASLGGTGAPTAIIIVTSRDDTGSGGASLAGPPPSAAVSLVSPLPAGPDACSHTATTGLGTWAAGAGAFVTVYDTACAHDMMFLEQDGLGDGVIGDVFPWCLPATASRSDGSAACVVDATLSGDAPCSSYPGMLDPLDPDGVRRPHMTAADAGTGGAGRVCEMNELAGAQADACLTGGSGCTGCSAGWCLAPTNVCAGGMVRFVQGVLPLGGADLHLLCDLPL